jgi:hypothetical protein
MNQWIENLSFDRALALVFATFATALILSTLFRIGAMLTI